MSPTGSDRNSGTRSSPWQTLKNSLPKLSAGDTLYLLSGTYFENSLTVNEKGTSASPITIAAAPGDAAAPVVDGGISDFYTAHKRQWTLADSASNTYKSVKTYTAGSGYTGAWLDDTDVQLVQYSSLADLESTTYGPLASGTHVYEGPGIMLNSDGHLYIRLNPNPDDLYDAKHYPISDPIRDHNPNDHSISVYRASHLMKFSGASYLHLSGIQFEAPETVFDTDASRGSTNITFTGDTIRYGTYGINIRAGSTGWTLTGNTMDNGFPPLTHWTDVKSSSNEREAYPEFQSDAITESSTGLTGFTITNNLIRDTMDGILVKDGSENDTIDGNYIIRAHDDGIWFYPGAGGGTKGVNVAYNMLWNVAGGIGVVYGTSTAAGPIYFRNNVVDDSIPTRTGRPGNTDISGGLPQWMTWSPFNGHSGTAALYMYIYNNTFVTRQSSGYPENAVGPAPDAPSSHKKVYDNIFYSLNDRVGQRDDQTSQGSSYNGNAYWRVHEGTTHPLFDNFANGSNYQTLALLQAANTGWETKGIQSDPGFSTTKLASATFDPGNPQALWSLYIPSASASELTDGYNLSSTGWPGAAADKGYRGACSRMCPSS